MPKVLRQYTPMEANASFSSMMSMSVERLRLYFERSLGIARVGPMPIIRGATPAMVAPTNLARMGWLSSWARERRIRRTAAAIGEGLLVDGLCRGWVRLYEPPSVTWLELPPVLRSPYWGKAGRILLRDSKVVPWRGPSSLVKVTSFISPVFGSLTFVLNGTISSSNHPAFCARSAR